MRRHTSRNGKLEQKKGNEEIKDGFLGKIILFAEKFDITLDKRLIKKYLKIILSAYGLVSLSLFIGVYYSLGSSDDSYLGMIWAQFPYLNSKRRSACEKFSELEKKYSFVEGASTVANFNNHLKSYCIIIGSKLLITVPIYKLFSIPKIVIFTVILAIIFKKKRNP